jgi:hypothetical protein
MGKKIVFPTAMLLVITLLFGVSLAIAAEVTGAKALFFSESGATISASKASPEKPKTMAKSSTREKYTGIAYQLAQLFPDGQFQVVPKSHTFESGDRVKFLVRTNQPGYLTVLNVGTSGMTHVLYNNYVQAMSVIEVPQGSNLQFVGPAGAEKVIMMLSSSPNPLGSPGGGPNQGPALIEAKRGSNTYASLEGSKDLVLEDNLKTKYAVISPKNNYRPVATGTKDMVLETDKGNGYNYGVVPAAAVSGGGILTLETTLRHR